VKKASYSFLTTLLITTTILALPVSVTHANVWQMGIDGHNSGYTMYGVKGQQEVIGEIPSGYFAQTIGFSDNVNGWWHAFGALADQNPVHTKLQAEYATGCGASTCQNYYDTVLCTFSTQQYYTDEMFSYYNGQANAFSYQNMNSLGCSVYNSPTEGSGSLHISGNIYVMAESNDYNNNDFSNLKAAMDGQNTLWTCSSQLNCGYYQIWHAPNAIGPYATVPLNPPPSSLGDYGQCGAVVYVDSSEPTYPDGIGGPGC